MNNIETRFLSRIVDSGTPITIFLVNGVKLRGSITEFDNVTCLLKRDGVTQLVYRHAISTIMP